MDQKSSHAIETKIKTPTSEDQNIQGSHSDSGRQRSELKSTRKNQEQEQENQRNKEGRRDDEALQQPNPSFQYQKVFIATESSHQSTDQQITNPNNSSDCDQTRFFCNLCKTRFKDGKTLQMHLLDHKEHRCNDCGKTYRRIKYLNSHKCPKLAETFICRVCKQRFYQKTKFDLHMSKHAAEGCVKCSKCAKSFACVRDCLRHQKDNVNCHIRLKEQESKLEESLQSVHSTVPGCSTSAFELQAKIENESDLKTRTPSTENQNIKSFHSDSVGQRTTTDIQNYSLTENEPNEEDRIDGGNQNTDQQKTDYESTFICTIWKNTFQVDRILNIHVLHHQETYFCHGCGETYYQQESFMKHPCSSRKVLKCQLCCQNLFQHHELDLHNWNHHPERSVKCERCSMLFSTVDDCEEHMNNNPFCYMGYKCHFCPKYFATKCKLNDHESKCSDRKQYQCHICAAFFDSSELLEQHFGIQHEN